LAHGRDGAARRLRPATCDATPGGRPPKGTGRPPGRCSHRSFLTVESDMKGILLWLIGVPIPIIILIYLLF
jgi:hypothetical protein